MSYLHWSSSDGRVGGYSHDNPFFPSDKVWLIEYAGLFFRDLTGHDMEVIL